MRALLDFWQHFIFARNGAVSCWRSLKSHVYRERDLVILGPWRQVVTDGLTAQKFKRPLLIWSPTLWVGKDWRVILPRAETQIKDVIWTGSAMKAIASSKSYAPMHRRYL